jgi:hypothetical protein
VRDFDVGAILLVEEYIETKLDYFSQALTDNDRSEELLESIDDDSRSITYSRDTTTHGISMSYNKFVILYDFNFLKKKLNDFFGDR